MNYPSIRIEGAILSPDLLERLEDAFGQKPADFGLEPSVKVKDEIARAWADAQDYWRIFQRRLDALKTDLPGTTETRQQWLNPLLGLLGYQLEYQGRGVELNGKVYTISHRLVNRGGTPVHIIGYRDLAGLDRKPGEGGVGEGSTGGGRSPTPRHSRMSAHAMVQEYLNLQDELYGIVTNGRVLRLLRDSSRLVKLTYLEFDLERIFNDGLFADFAIFYRLLHATRLPVATDQAADSLIERYHQDSLDAGARIRNGLSRAVEQAIRDFGNGFLAHSANDELRGAVASGELKPDAYYQYLLRLIYRLLFLMVIEERNLVHPPQADARQRAIYDDFYSVQRLRRLSEKRHLEDKRRHDLWLSLLATFRLFEADGPGQRLGLAPLAGELFSPDAIGALGRSMLGNDVLLGCLRALNLYRHPATNQLIRVNYGALNVEEFGSVYEGLLEYSPVFAPAGQRVEFAFAQGDARTATGSHYTDDDLVQPLLKHSLDYLIEERLREAAARSLLSLRVADISCGSGHILLAAARRIATALAMVRTGEEQPSPAAFRSAVRDVIRTCIYGVDLNPLAVELCKVALWLEAHIPGEPLNFLDHHIKCGNAIVGFVQRDELEKGVPDEAFATLPADDKNVVKLLRQRNRREHRQWAQLSLNLAPAVQQRLDGVLRRWRELSALPERTPAEIDAKRARYLAFTASGDAWLLNQIAAIPIAQFYLPKTKANQALVITDGEYREYLAGRRPPQGQATAAAWAMALHKRFFHWFLEFPEVMAQGGFDCILGNPPYLGGQALSGAYGHPFGAYVKWQYAPAGLSDLVVYFVRRIYSLLRPNGLTAFITTNSIKDGDVRKDGLEQVLAQGGAINFAVRGVKWPGQANLVVSLVGIRKGEWRGKRVLDGKEVGVISAYFEDSVDQDAPVELYENADQVFQGSIFLGDGFLLTHEEAQRLVDAEPRNRDVIFKAINGQEINNEPTQAPGRSIINFFDWPIDKAQEYTLPFRIVEDKVKPFRKTQNRVRNREIWWIYAEHRPGLNRNLRPIDYCFVAARTTKHLNFSAMPTDYVFTDALYVFTTDRWDLYAVVQSTLHEVWARKYSGALKQDLRYSPSNCFETFPFPAGLWRVANPRLAEAGERYHEHRRGLMRHLWLGLTDIYNLFHARDLTPALVAKVSKQDAAQAEAGYVGLLELRRLHVALDDAVAGAYGWADLDLGHGFVEVETLAENDRVRYTISPGARKETLRRLLALNHQRAAEEQASAATDRAGKKGGRGKALKEEMLPIELF